MQEYELKNYMLELVNLTLPKFLQDNVQKYGEIVLQPDVEMKIKALSLNMLPAMYITTKVGAVYGEYNMREMQKQADLAMAFSKACETVLSNIENN